MESLDAQNQVISTLLKQMQAELDASKRQDLSRLLRLARYRLADLRRARAVREALSGVID